MPHSSLHQILYALRIPLYSLHFTLSTFHIPHSTFLIPLYTILLALLALGTAKAADTFTVNGVVYERLTTMALDRDGDIRQAARVYNILSGTKVTIPAEVWDVTDHSFRMVSEVDGRAMNTTASVEELTLPYSVTTVRSSAFSGCTKLRKVTFETDDRWLMPLTIGSQAFDGCTSLTDVTFPKHLITIDNYAFRGCSSLTTVHNFEYRSGSKCPQLKTIGMCAFLDCRMLNLSLNLPKLAEVGSSAFRSTDIRSVYINQSLQTLSSNAFMDCTHLKSIYTQSNAQLSIIGTGAFQNCSTLAYFYEYVSGKYTEVDYPPHCVTIIKDKAFKGCSVLGSVKGLALTRQSASIGSEAFAETGIIALSLGQYVTQLGEGAFRRCTSLRDIWFSPQCGVTTLPQSCFEGCTTLDRCFWESGSYVDHLPSSIRVVGPKAFKDCTKLGSTMGLELSGPNLTSIGQCAFQNTGITALRSGTNSALTTIGPEAFLSCKSLQSVILPKTVTTVGDRSFQYCSALTTYRASDAEKVMSYGTAVFRDCAKLSTFTVKAMSMVNIPDSLFYGCSSLDLSFSGLSTLNSIGRYAFYNCVKMQARQSLTLYILKSIGAYAFRGCTSLQRFGLPALTTTIGEGAFLGCSNLSEFEITESCSLTSIGHYAFQNCTSLTSIRLPKTLKAIGTNAFINTPRLSTVLCEMTGAPLSITDDTFTSSLKTGGAKGTTQDPTGTLIVTDKKNYPAYTTATGWKRFKHRMQSTSFLECKPEPTTIY